MIKLLNAGFRRLRKNKIFWVLSFFNIGFALFVIYAQYNQMIKYDQVVDVSQLLLEYSTMIGVIIAVFTSIFLGVEYSDGAIRNKISIGHKRTHIYLSNLIITIATSLFSYILFMIIILCIGIPLFGNLTMPMAKLLTSLGSIFVTIIAYCSIFTFLSMTISNKTIAAITEILLAFLMIMATLNCLNILQAPKMIQTATMVNGETKIETIPNPEYPSEAKKKTIKILLNLNPSGQMVQIAGGLASDIKILPLYSLGNIIIFTSLGLIIFKTKELK